jgi:hypothetical protein
VVIWFDFGFHSVVVTTMGDNRAATERFAGAMENLVLLAESMQQASALLGDADEGDSPTTSSTSFLSAAVLGNVVSLWFLFNQVFCAFSHDHSMSLSLSLSLSL